MEQNVRVGARPGSHFDTLPSWTITDKYHKNEAFL